MVAMRSPWPAAPSMPGRTRMPRPMSPVWKNTPPNTCSGSNANPPWNPTADCAAAGVGNAVSMKTGERSDQRDSGPP